MACRSAARGKPRARHTHTAKEYAMDVGMMLLFASYGWEHIGDDQGSIR
jgi:hypothetical protein